jgi:hypothetical protein
MSAYITIQINPVFTKLYPNTFSPWVFSSLKDLFSKVIDFENSNNAMSGN